jgi:hypothetical protein
MSADNFLYVKRNGEVWMGFASDERPADSYGVVQYQGIDFQDALDWAHQFCAEEYVEYGVSVEKQTPAGRQAEIEMMDTISRLINGKSDLPMERTDGTRLVVGGPEGRFLLGVSKL